MYRLGWAVLCGKGHGDIQSHIQSEYAKFQDKFMTCHFEIVNSMNHSSKVLVHV